MAKLQNLRQYFVEVGEPQLKADAYALWLFWHGGVNPVVLQTLEDYGGLKLVEVDDQALYFFFSSEDVLLAAARLGVWARFNPMNLGLEVFPARLHTGKDGQKNLIVDESYWQQDVIPPMEFKIWAHSAMVSTAEKTPGVSLQTSTDSSGQGPDKAHWHLLDVDPRLPYQSQLSWYAVVHPVGNSHDKAFHLGWREYFGQLEAVLQRNKFRFSVYEAFLMFPLDSLRQVKTWCRDFFALVARLKAESPESYWPCVLAVVDRKGLSISEDLPNKIDLNWDQLVPDYPHMSLKNALLLGPEFLAHEVRFSPTRHQADDWVSVTIKVEDEGSSGTLTQLVPVNLVFGEHAPCFYCGQRSHPASECPSREIPTKQGGVWPKVATLDFDVMRSLVTKLDAQLGAAEEKAKAAAAAGGGEEQGKQGVIAALLKEEGSEDSIMLRAFYDLVWPVQLRAVHFFWRARNKDLNKAAKALVAVDDSPTWSILSAFPKMDSAEQDEALKEMAVKNSKDFRYQSLRGFWAMEKGEYEKAVDFWKEAERLSPHPIVQSWHCFLQARALECLGQFTLAGLSYDQVARSCPQWYDAEYRRCVCQVKNGFTENALAAMRKLIDKSGHFFNRAVIDPELERGYIQVMSFLYTIWSSMSLRAKEEIAALSRMRDELGSWFLPDNVFAGEMAERIDALLERGSIQNYVPYQLLIHGRARVEREIQNHVLIQTKIFKESFKALNARLKIIHAESAWFPFRRTLVEFNRSYNEAVANNNWALTANLHTAENFRKAQMLLEKERERAEKLENRLRFLRVVRDSTLFVMVMMETFFWLEIIGLALVFIPVVVIATYGNQLGLNELSAVLASGDMQVHKAIFLILTLFMFTMAALRTLFRFEKMRDDLLRKAKEGLIKPGERKEKRK